MPLLKLQDIGMSARLAVWEIKEAEKFFTEQLPADYLPKDFHAIPFSPRRKLEYLASRYLLFLLLKDENVVISKDENGKPVVLNRPLKISISHTKDLAAAIVSETCDVGLDIENIHERIHRVKHKFLNESEKEFLGENPSTETLTLCWSAKESIYKWYGKKELSFQENMLLEKPSGERNFFTGYFKDGSKETKLCIYHQRIKNSVLTYVME